MCAQRETTKDWWPLGLNVGSPRFSVSAGSICDRLRQSRASVCEEWFVLDRTRPHKPKALTRPHSLDLYVFLAVARTPLYALSNSPRAHTRVHACPDFQQKTRACTHVQISSRKHARYFSLALLTLARQHACPIYALRLHYFQPHSGRSSYSAETCTVCVVDAWTFFWVWLGN